VNRKERQEWIRAVGACLPDAEIRPMLKAADALDDACAGRWEASVSGLGPKLAGLRFFGSADYAAFKKAAAEAFALKAVLPEAPAAGFPWLAASWDLGTGRRIALRLFGAGARGQAAAVDYGPKGQLAKRVALRPARFDARIFEEPALERALAEFHRLCPASSLTIEPSGWALKLESPLRWPLFARCDLSAAFAPSSSQLALFLLDRKVTELTFDGEALWAHCAG
jgi:hypothetical protein